MDPLNKETGYTKVVQNPFKRVKGGEAALFDLETIYVILLE